MAESASGPTTLRWRMFGKKYPAQGLVRIGNKGGDFKRDHYRAQFFRFYCRPEKVKVALARIQMLRWSAPVSKAKLTGGIGLTVRAKGNLFRDFKQTCDWRLAASMQFKR